MAVTVLIPGILTWISEMCFKDAKEYIPFASIQQQLCYMGMLFLGRLLYEYAEEQWKNVLDDKAVNMRMPVCAACIMVVLGLLAIIMSSVWLGHMHQKSMHTMFSEVRLPAVIYGSGVFLLFVYLKNTFDKIGEGCKAVIYKVSKVSLGTYMAHQLWIWVFPNMVILGHDFDHSVNIKGVIVCSMFVFMTSVLFSLLLSKIKILNKLV